MGLLILAVVILAPSLSSLIQQRQQIADQQKAVDELSAQVNDLKEQRARWNDPSYIRSQARDRLYYVMPGEVSYLVIDDRPPAAKAADDDPGQLETPEDPDRLDRHAVRLLHGRRSEPGDTGSARRHRDRTGQHSHPDPHPRRLNMTTPPFDPVTAEDIATVSAQLGRPARNVVGIAARCVCGRPTVVSTAPRLDDGTPFPTLYYLTHPAATAAMSQLEATQVMNEYNAMLEEDADLREQYAAAHEAYLADRESIAVVEEIAGISAGGMPVRVKCLHALGAHALAAGPGRQPHRRPRPRRAPTGRPPCASASSASMIRSRR